LQVTDANEDDDDEEEGIQTVIVQQDDNTHKKVSQWHKAYSSHTSSLVSCLIAQWS
jgi:hypothetical protein